MLLLRYLIKSPGKAGLKINLGIVSKYRTWQSWRTVCTCWTDLHQGQHCTQRKTNHNKETELSPLSLSTCTHITPCSRNVYIHPTPT